MTKIKGHCECKSVSFEINQKITHFSHCHCSQCRRSHGAAFGSYIEVKNSSLHYYFGEDHLKSYASSKYSQRIFCKECGSNIMFVNDHITDRCYVALGLIDGDPELPKAEHIFVESKAPWHEINDDLKQYDEEPADSDHADLYPEK